MMLLHPIGRLGKDASQRGSLMRIPVGQQRRYLPCPDLIGALDAD
jgi:hypothetical protein